MAPAPDTYRAAFLGPSFVMGSGVADNETFEALLEARLNMENEGGNYQVLNFGVAGHSVLQQLMVLEDKALAFHPNTVFLVSHQFEEEIAVRNLASLAQKGVDLPYDYLDELVAKAGITSDMTDVEAEKRLQPYARELIVWAYDRIVELSKEEDAVPVWIFMPTLEAAVSEEYATELMGVANEAGFVTVNLADLYQDQDLEALIVAPWDRHPNAKAHRLIAERLYQFLQEQGQFTLLGADN